MTRLSDLLRGAADRAPVGEASVSIERARRRVRIQRGARGVANGLAGAGAAALVFLGVVNPTLATSREMDDLALAPYPAQDDGGKHLGGGDETATNAFYSGYWGSCGASLDEGPGDYSESLTLVIDSDGWLDLEGGATVDIPTNLTVTGDLEVRTTGPEAVLLYDGLVVARLDQDQVIGIPETDETEQAPDTEQILDLASGDVIDSTLAFPLVNCFDGAPLPAAKYELVASQGFSTVTEEPVPEPTVVPTPGPTTVPEPEPGTARTSTDAPIEVASDIVEPDPSVMPVEPPPWDYRETSTAVTLTVAGDPVDDPFGAYIWTAPDKPTDILTPAKARELYQAGLVTGTWDMTPGTSRWIVPNYETDPSYASTRSAASGWYGCGCNGSNSMTFPTQSAALDLLDVSATFPSRANISYGWIVDGNPEIHFTVTNTSEYSLPGFYGEPSRQLYLVRDGRVAAEAYPQNMYPYAGDIAYDTPSMEGAGDASEYWGTLSPGAALKGDYLWRDLNGCWTDSGPRPVTAGTYTLVAAQTIYIESPNGSDPILYREFDVDLTDDDGVMTIDPGINPGVEPTIDPYYTYDSVELQVWTSLGNVTITTN